MTIAASSALTLSPADKAEVIYEQARSEMASRLWRAALGVDEQAPQSGSTDKRLPTSLNLLLALLDERGGMTPQASQAAVVPPAGQLGRAAPELQSEPDGQRAGPNAGEPQDHHDNGMASPSSGGGGYGPNAGYAGILGAASRRTGLPVASLATIVHAEAAKAPDGRWLPYSRNPRSSAAGLGQFLNGTWRGEAERKGTWLNIVAQRQGWLNDQGQVKGEHRAALLALRYDPEASIQATADYAAANLDALRRAGVEIGDGAQALARAAYLGHHLGRGDAIRFLKGGLDPDRARTLLNAQVGTAAATRRIAESSNAAAAHRTWLLDYMGRNIRAERFNV